MLNRLRSEIAYFKGVRRVLARIACITAAPAETFCDHAELWARQFGERPALLSERENFSYHVWNGRANRYARWARAAGLAKGDVVCLLMSNRPEYMSIWLGLGRAGLITALINTELRGHSLAHCVNVAAPKAMIVESSLAPQLASAFPQLNPGISLWAHGATEGGEPQMDEAIETFSDATLAPDEQIALTVEDPVLYLYTSGTTGLPKAARINHARLQRIMYSTSAVMNARATDRMYLCLPMYHVVGGLVGTGSVLSVGGSCYIRERFSAREFWSDASRNQCTLFVYVGELCRYLLNQPRGPEDRSHRIRTCLGVGLRPDIFAKFRDRFAIGRVIEFYGSTEGNVALFNLDSCAGAIGRIPKWMARLVHVKIVAFDYERSEVRRDERGRCVECGAGEAGEMIGEISDDAKMPGAKFDGYVDALSTRTKILRDLFVEGDAWFRTGDIVRRDVKGYFYFVDRIGDTFRWKGENVSTTEVAEVIAVFPGVREVNVYGVRVPGHDDRACMAALVVDDTALFDLAKFHAYLAGQLPFYARPMFLRFLSDMKVTGTFKLIKTDLVAEGFDPLRVDDPVFHYNREEDAYSRIGTEFMADLGNGKVKL